VIHPTAIVAEGARVHPEARIGPYCVVGEHVRIGAGTELMSHVVVGGRTTIGEHNRLFPFAAVGGEPQDLKYHGEPSEVIIGNRNTIRENVTINTGTEGGGMVTRIGDGNLLMAYVHVAHDCQIGNEVVLANCATLAGHIEIADGVIVGGLSAIHQFVRIGRYVMIGGMCGINKDVPPFCLVSGGYRAELTGLNLVGLKRRGFSMDDVRLLKQVYRLLFQGGESLAERIGQARDLAGDDPHALEMIEFAETAQRGLVLHKRDAG